MIQQWLFKLLLAPFSLLYGIGVAIYHGLYKVRILQGLKFSIPVLSIGNLTVGGTGKTPHTEYLIQQLRPYLDLAILSRGYGRNTKGLKEVQLRDNAVSVGDEPFMFKLKYRDVSVVVSESRGFAIPQMISKNPQLQLILLDDGFQHRAVEPDMNILLTEYDQPYYADYLLPMGRLRERRKGAERADAIVVTKCPENLSETDRQSMREKLRKGSKQRVFFSKYKYHKPYLLTDSSRRLQLEPDMSVLLVSAIARTEYLTHYLESQVDGIQVMSFKDHHYYKGYDIDDIAKRFNAINAKKKYILSTEKDATRLFLLQDKIQSLGLEIYLLPVEVVFIEEEGEPFIDYIKNELLNYRN